MDTPRRQRVPISETSQTARRAISIKGWRLCRTLTIHDTVLLILGEDPADMEWAADPPGYAAWVSAIVTAAEGGAIKGVGKFKREMRSDGSYFTSDETDPLTSTIEVDSLKLWLSAKGQRPVAFFPDVARDETPSLPQYLQEKHPRFALKLKAAVEAWEAMEDPTNLKLGNTPRQALEAWLSKNASRLGLVDKEGKPIKETIQNVAKIANWNSQGGAPRTGAKLSSR